MIRQPCLGLRPSKRPLGHALRVISAVTCLSAAVAAQDKRTALLPPPPAEDSAAVDSSAKPSSLPESAALPTSPEKLNVQLANAVAPVGPLPTPSEFVAPPNPVMGDGPLLGAGDAAAATEFGSGAVAPPVSWYQPSYWFGPQPWDVGIELGINGTQGTREAFSFRGGGHLKRKTDRSEFSAEAFYNRNTSAGIETQNNAQLDARHDWLLADSPWTIFGLTTILYDEFQAFDLRLALSGGLGYQIWETDTISLLGRFGAGTSREFGGPDNTWLPEAVFGGEFSYKISKAQKFHIKTEYFPTWEDYREYRVVTDAGWSVKLDHPGNTSLELSVNNQHDSTPNGADPNLLNYSVLLIWAL